MSLREEALKLDARFLHPTPADTKAPSPKPPLPSSSWTIKVLGSFSAWTCLLEETIKKLKDIVDGYSILMYDAGLKFNHHLFTVLETPHSLSELLDPDLSEICLQNDPRSTIRRYARGQLSVEDPNYKTHFPFELEGVDYTWKLVELDGISCREKDYVLDSPYNREGPQALQTQWWIKRNHPLYIEKSNIIRARDVKIGDTLDAMRNPLKQKLLDFYKEIRSPNRSSSMTKSEDKAWKMLISRLLVVSGTPRPDLLPPTFTTPSIIKKETLVAEHTEQATQSSAKKYNEKLEHKTEEEDNQKSCEISESNWKSAVKSEIYYDWE